MWGYSSVGRAVASHVTGLGFESPYLHHNTKSADKTALFILLTRFLHDFIQNFNRTFFFTGVEVGICIPRHFYICVTQTPCNLLYVDSLVSQKRHVRMPVIVNPYLFKPCDFGDVFISLADRAVANRFLTAAYSEIVRELRIFTVTLFDKNFSFALYISSAENSTSATLKAEKFLSYFVPLLLLHLKNDFCQRFLKSLYFF